MIYPILAGLSGGKIAEPIVTIFGSLKKPKRRIVLPPGILNEIFEYFMLIHWNGKCSKSNDCKLRKYDVNCRKKDGPCQKDVALLDLAQMNQSFRASFLPKVWECLVINSIYTLQLYDRFLSSTPNVKSIYGQHIREIKFYSTCFDHCPTGAEEFLLGLQSAFSLIIRSGEKRTTSKPGPNGNVNGPDGFGSLSYITSAANLKMAFERIFRFSRNLEVLFWVSTLIPFPLYLSNVLQKHCQKMHTFILEDTVSMPFSDHLSYVQPRSEIPMLNKLNVLGILDCHHRSANCNVNLAPSVWIESDPGSRFGFYVVPDLDPDYGAPSPIWIVEQCLIGAEHSLRHLILSSHLLLVIPNLLPLWLFFEKVEVKSIEVWESYIYSQPAAEDTIAWLRKRLLAYEGKSDSNWLKNAILQLYREIVHDPSYSEYPTFEVSQSDLNNFDQNKYKEESLRIRLSLCIFLLSEESTIIFKSIQRVLEDLS